MAIYGHYHLQAMAMIIARMAIVIAISICQKMAILIAIMAIISWHLWPLALPFMAIYYCP